MRVEFQTFGFYTPPRPGGDRGALKLSLLSAVFAFLVFFPAQDATGNLFEWQQGIFGADGPVSQLERIRRRHSLALLKHLQHKPRQFCSGGHPS